MRVCVCISEGKSERIFLPSLLVNSFGFVEQGSKSNDFFMKDDVCWLFPVPTLGKTHRGGKHALVKKWTYMKAIGMLTQNRYRVPVGSYIHFLIVRDTDSLTGADLDNAKAKVVAAARSFLGGTDPIDVLCPKKEIESWFVAGINDQLPIIDRSKSLTKLLSVDPDSIDRPKNFLETYLLSDVVGDEIKIAMECGRYFDLDAAKNRSASFRGTLDFLTNHRLL